MSKKLTIIIFSGATLTAVIAWRGILLLNLARSVKPTTSYWHNLSAQPTAAGDFVYVALGDSAAQGIGASQHSLGYVGLIAAGLTRTTGRNVHIINLSVTGARAADVVREQLPRLKLLHPDLVTMEIGANDAVHGTPNPDFERDFAAILDAMPASVSVVSDLPSFGSARVHQRVEVWNGYIQRQLAQRSIKLAHLNDTTRPGEHRLDTYAADFFHPSDKGYRNWYEAFWPEINSILTKKPATEVAGKV